MKAQHIFLFLLLSCITTSCNITSHKNFSNDFKWKNKKFAQPLAIVVDYNPEIKIDLPQKKAPLFYNYTDTIQIDSVYRIKELLLKKCKKRNILAKDSSTIKLVIDKLIFEEYTEAVSVSDNDSEYIGEFDKDHFKFEIQGKLYLNDSLLKDPIRIEYLHTTEPRESFVFNGIIVYDGIHASAPKMIENAINMFSYQLYNRLKQL